MLSTIKRHIFKDHQPQDAKGIFFSLFNQQGELLVSNGVIETDKSLSETVETLRNGILSQYEKSTALITVDVVLDIHQETDVKIIMQTDMKKYGIFVATQNQSVSGSILPNTEGIADVKHALYVLKQKYPGLDGNVNIRFFTTQRIVVNPKKKIP